MAPEHEARLRADFYDPESETPRRRRRPAADWGVGEDIFDRMPSRSSRVDRRAGRHDVIVLERADEERSGSERQVTSWGADAWAQPERSPRGEDAARETWPADGAREPHAAAAWGDDTRPTRGVGAWADDARGPSGAGAWAENARRPRSAKAPGSSRGSRVVESWHQDDDPDFDGRLPAADKPRVDSWMDDAPLVPGESRTIVLGGDESFAPPVDPDAPKQRRTVLISGHPDRRPAPRAQRPPRTAVERIGASPDRIVAWAVALGFLLVLIAVLTTGQ